MIESSLCRKILEVDRVEAPLPGQLQLGGRLQNLPVQHLGVEPRAGFHQRTAEARDPLVETHVGHIQQPSPRRRDRHDPAFGAVSQPVRCSSRA